MPITNQEKIYLDAYICNGSVRKSASKAGILNIKEAYAILGRLEPKEYLERKTKEYNKNTAITYGWKLKMLVSVAEEAKYNRNYPAAIAAIAELNRMQGHYGGDPDIGQDAHFKRLVEVSSILMQENRIELDYMKEPEVVNEPIEEEERQDE